MRISTKKIIVTALIAFLIVALVCLLPWPTRVNVQMTGIEVTSDGTSLHNQTIHVEGWKLNYLFRDDTVKLDIQVSGTNNLELNGQKHMPIFQHSNEFDYASWFVYIADINRMDVLSVYLDKDLNWLVFSVNDRCFVASTNPDADLQVYWEMCADRIR